MIQGKRVVRAVGDIKHHHFCYYSKCNPASLLEVVFSAMGQPLGVILAYLPWLMIPGQALCCLPIDVLMGLDIDQLVKQRKTSLG